MSDRGAIASPLPFAVSPVLFAGTRAPQASATPRTPAEQLVVDAERGSGNALHRAASKCDSGCQDRLTAREAQLQRVLELDLQAEMGSLQWCEEQVTAAQEEAEEARQRAHGLASRLHECEVEVQRLSGPGEGQSPARRERVSALRSEQAPAASLRVQPRAPQAATRMPADLACAAAAPSAEPCPAVPHAAAAVSEVPANNEAAHMVQAEMRKLRRELRHVRRRLAAVESAPRAPPARFSRAHHRRGDAHTTALVGTHWRRVGRFQDALHVECSPAKSQWMDENWAAQTRGVQAGTSPQRLL